MTPSNSDSHGLYGSPDKKHERHHDLRPSQIYLGAAEIPLVKASVPYALVKPAGTVQVRSSVKRVRQERSQKPLLPSERTAKLIAFNSLADTAL